MDSTGKKERAPSEDQSPEPNTGKPINGGHDTAGGYNGQEDSPPNADFMGSIRSTIGGIRVALPGAGRSDSEFSRDLAKHIPKDLLFLRNGEAVTIEEPDAGEGVNR